MMVCTVATRIVMVVMRVLRTVPAEECLVGFGCRTTLHAWRNRARRLSCRTVSFLEVSGPESNPQVLPAIDDGTGSEGPQELLQFLLEFGRNARTETGAVW